MDDLLAHTRIRTDWTIDGPHGNVVVEGPTSEALWLIAGGTGIAQCCGIADHLDRVGQVQPVTLLWSVTDPLHFYCDSQLRAFTRWLSYRPLTDAPGRQNAAAMWLRQTRTIVGGRIILSGSPGFVYAVEHVLRDIAIEGASIESDVFSYAPR